MTTEKFTFGEHPRCVEMMQHTMSFCKENGACVTVETEHLTHRKFVVHTVVAEFPNKLNPIKFTRGPGA